MPPIIFINAFINVPFTLHACFRYHEVAVVWTLHVGSAPGDRIQNVIQISVKVMETDNKASP